MSGIAGIVNWSKKPVDPQQMQLMMQMIEHRSPDGWNCQTKEYLGFGHGLLALKKVELEEKQPIWLPDESMAIVADARLYNRREILGRLGEVSWFHGTPSDAALILAAYERWAEGLLDIIDGDFAFAIWDYKRHRLFAARDPFGVKPFFYRWDGQSFMFASESKQILVMPEVSVEPDKTIIGEYLFQKYEEFEHTFFSGILRLPQSYFLIATPVSVERKRYWNPNPEAEIHYSNQQDYYDNFRELLKDAVDKRLNTEFSVGVQLSGGMDSSSIVVMAEEIYRNTKRKRPWLETISATYGNLPCDETVYFQSVVKKVSFPSHTFNPIDEPLTLGLVEELWRNDSPLLDIQRGFFKRCTQILSESGARILISGIGGDELVHEEYYLRDLALRRRFLVLLIEAWIASKTSWNSFGLLFTDALRATIPEPIKHLYRLAQKQKQGKIPDWINPEFWDYFTQCPEPPSLPPMGFHSLTQESVFSWLTSVGMSWCLETLERLSAYHGFEYRYPFLDRPLVEFVLAIPFEERIPKGQWKYLLKRSLASDLPSEVLNRPRKTMFTSYNNYVMAQAKSELMEIIFDRRPWLSQPYILKQEAIRLFETTSVEMELFSLKTDTLWKIATLELWLRQLSRY